MMKSNQIFLTNTALMATSHVAQALSIPCFLYERTQRAVGIVAKVTFLLSLVVGVSIETSNAETTKSPDPIEGIWELVPEKGKRKKSINPDYNPFGKVIYLYKDNVLYSCLENRVEKGKYEMRGEGPSQHLSITDIKYRSVLRDGTPYDRRVLYKKAIFKREGENLQIASNIFEIPKDFNTGNVLTLKRIPYSKELHGKIAKAHKDYYYNIRKNKFMMSTMNNVLDELEPVQELTLEEGQGNKALAKHLERIRQAKDASHEAAELQALVRWAERSMHSHNIGISLDEDCPPLRDTDLLSLSKWPQVTLQVWSSCDNESPQDQHAFVQAKIQFKDPNNVKRLIPLGVITDAGLLEASLHRLNDPDSDRSKLRDAESENKKRLHWAYRYWVASNHGGQSPSYSNIKKELKDFSPKNHRADDEEAVAMLDDIVRKKVGDYLGVFIVDTNYGYDLGLSHQELLALSKWKQVKLTLKWYEHNPDPDSMFNLKEETDITFKNPMNVLLLLPHTEAMPKVETGIHAAAANVGADKPLLDLLAELQRVAAYGGKPGRFTMEKLQNPKEVVWLSNLEKEVGLEPAIIKMAEAHEKGLFNPKEISLYSSYLSAEAFSSLTKIKSISTLDLSVDDIHAGQLRKLGDLVNLEELEMHGNVNEDVWTASLAEMPALKKLTLSGSSCNSCFHDLAKSKNLEELAVRHTKLTDDDLKAIALLPSLKKLSLDSITFPDGGLQPLQASKSLEHLEMGYSSLEHKKEKFVFLNLSEMRLRHLDVSGREWFNDHHVEQLGNSATLEELNLSDTSVTDRSLVKLNRFSNLKRLWLQFRSFRMKQIPAGGRIHEDEITTYPGITGKGIVALAQCEKLELLDITDVGIEPEYKAAFEKMRPKCEVIGGVLPR